MLSTTTHTLTIDQATLVGLIQAGTVNGANVIGQPGGWEVVVRYGRTQRTLAAKRGQVRLFRKMDTLVGFLKTIGLNQYQVDASRFDPVVHKATRTNIAASERLKKAHQAAEHEKWFQEEIGLALKEADHPNTQWIANDEVKATSAKRRAAWLKQS